jgi:hypothetical protein
LIEVTSEPWVYLFTFQRQDPEDALMHAAQWFPAYETLQRLDTQGKLPAGQRALGADAAGAEAFKVLREQVFGTIDDAEVLWAAAIRLGYSGCRSWERRKRIAAFRGWAQCSSVGESKCTV